MARRTGIGGGVIVALVLGAAGARAQDVITDPVVEEPVVITIDPTLVLDGEAESNQALTGNTIVERDVLRQALIDGSFAGNNGIMSVNQAAGDLNNQGIVRSFVVGESAGPVVAMLDANGNQGRSGNSVVQSGPRSDRLTDSFAGGAGVVGVNQAAGSLNQQVNVLVMGLAETTGDTFYLMADAVLGQVIGAADTIVEDPDSPREDVIDGAFAGFTGIAQVAQSAGDLNDVGNVMAVQVTVMTVAP